MWLAHEPDTFNQGMDFFFIVGGLYSVTALRENDQERGTVYTAHRLWCERLWVGFGGHLLRARAKAVIR